MRRARLIAAALAICAAGVAQPASAAEHEGDAAPETEEVRREARAAVSVRGLDRGRVRVGDRVTVAAMLRPFAPGQRLKLVLERDGKVVERRMARVRRVRGKDAGRASFLSDRVIDRGRYVARAVHKRTLRLTHAQASSKPFRIRYPALDYGSRGADVRTFHRLLARAGYANAPSGRKFNPASGRAVHAFRKVNRMARNEEASSDVFRKLAAGKGEFKLRYPGAGKHVEIDLARQVMVLAEDGRPRYTYHISSGAPATPSDRGMFRFYRKDPGYNSIGMYYSVYYNRGEATHGYASVPDYPASHGCIRNPIPDSIFIYNWIDLGDPIWVY